MLFRKKIERSCAYCQYGTCIGQENILCAKKGVRTAGDSCRKTHPAFPVRLVSILPGRVLFGAEEISCFSVDKPPHLWL